MEKGTECQTDRCGTLKLIKYRRVGESVLPHRIFFKNWRLSEYRQSTKESKLRDF